MIRASCTEGRFERVVIEKVKVENYVKDKNASFEKEEEL